MNLFRFFRFKINRDLPLGLGRKKILDKNCPSCGSHSDIAPTESNSLIDTSNCIFSESVYAGVCGIWF